MPHLTQDKATRLMLRTCDPPRIRIADNLLDLDEAKPAADAMFAILQTDYQWSFPSADKHLATWHDDRDKSRCTRSANEDEKLYQQRLERWTAWPIYKTDQQFQWLRCAIITSNALHYLQQCHDKGLTLDVKCTQGYRYEFIPEEFFEYIWICLNQGYGTQQWKSPPWNSLLSREAGGAVLAVSAQKLLAGVVDQWEQGKDLSTQYPLITLEDLLPTPYHKEYITVERAANK
ncbi:hypothetical protein FocnCong_v020780 [Fusarium oxysporum f. sp. conglutinans]|nr:hypothetical protein FocnCong_v020780 [Fusarium oxysporum f. sp. conglutinans]